MKVNYTSIIVLCCVFLGCACQYFNINSSYKRIKHPGVSSGTSFIEYTIEFNSNTEFIIEKVSLQNNKNYDFSLFSSNRKNYVKPNKKHDKGTYIVTFKSNNIKTIDTKDIVLLFLNVDGKIKQQKIPVLKKKAFRGR
jgi:hypothetical protein